MAARPREVALLTEIPIAGTPSCPTGPPCRLNGTSQGRQDDIPPEDWIEEELVRYHVVGTSNVRPSNLTGNPHPIFHRQRWPGMDDKRFNAMNQSILLASTLLEIGLPYLASFLPDPNYAEGFNPRKHDNRQYDRVDIRAVLTDHDIQVVRNELNEISKGLEWWEDPHMFGSRGWWGITTSCYPRATEDFAKTRIISSKQMDEELREAGFERRQNTIGIATQYIDTLLNSDGGTEQHLCAAFHLAVTLVHEIGHLVYWQNLRNLTDYMGQEPVVENQVSRELGFAFTAWLFGGWNPQPILDYQKDQKIFHRGMFWKKQFTYQYRPRWIMHYSMPFSYIQRLMTQSTWDAWAGRLNHGDVKTILKAPAPFRYGQDARVAHCEKRDTGFGWKWKRRNDPLLLFNYDEDDDEDFFQKPPGIPPFGFHDGDWTAGPEAEVYPKQAYSGKAGFQQVSLTSERESPRQHQRPAPPLPSSVQISVTYSGIYDSCGGKIILPGSPPGEHAGNEIHYMDWPEGVLRSLCSECDISSFGGKSELIARLKQFDAANAERNIGHIENALGAPGGSSKRKKLLGRLTYNLELSTTVDDFQQIVYKDTGIPLGMQLITLDGIGIAQLKESQARPTLESWRHNSGWDNMLLYRIQRAPKGDPGPLPHRVQPDERVEQLKYAGLDSKYGAAV